MFKKHWPVSLRSNRKFWERCFSALRLYSFTSSLTVGKGGRRRDASFPEEAIVQTNTVKNKHTWKVRELMIDPLSQHLSFFSLLHTGAVRQKHLPVLKRETCDALMFIISCQLWCYKIEKYVKSGVTFSNADAKSNVVEYCALVEGLFTVLI